MIITMRYILDEQEVTAEAFRANFTEPKIYAVIDGAKTQLIEKVRAATGLLRCLEHGEQPELIIHFAYSNATGKIGVQYEINGCCELVVGDVQRRIREVVGL